MAGRSLSAPAHGLDNMDALPPSSPDSSDVASEDSSGLTNISEARDVDAGGSQDPLLNNDNLPDTHVDPLDLVSDSNSKSLSGRLPAPRPGSAIGDGYVVNGRSRPGSGMEKGIVSPGRSREGTPNGSDTYRSGRPGSSRHPVLPPIGQSDSIILPEY